MQKDAVEKVKEALRPFARISGAKPNDFPHATVLFENNGRVIVFGDILRAREALQALEEEK